MLPNLSDLRVPLMKESKSRFNRMFIEYPVLSEMLQEKKVSIEVVEKKASLSDR